MDNITQDFEPIYNTLTSLTKPSQKRECKKLVQSFEDNSLKPSSLKHLITKVAGLTDSSTLLKIIREAAYQPQGELSVYISEGRADKIEEYAMRQGYIEPDISL